MVAGYRLQSGLDQGLESYEEDSKASTAKVKVSAGQRWVWNDGNLMFPVFDTHTRVHASAIP